MREPNRGRPQFDRANDRLRVQGRCELRNGDERRAGTAIRPRSRTGAERGRRPAAGQGGAVGRLKAVREARNPPKDCRSAGRRDRAGPTRRAAGAGATSPAPVAARRPATDRDPAAGRTRICRLRRRPALLRSGVRRKRPEDSANTRAAGPATSTDAPPPSGANRREVGCGGRTRERSSNRSGTRPSRMLSSLND